MSLLFLKMLFLRNVKNYKYIKSTILQIKDISALNYQIGQSYAAPAPKDLEKKSPAAPKKGKKDLPPVSNNWKRKIPRSHQIMRKRVSILHVIKIFFVEGSRILIPVHVVTTLTWFITLYIICESGYDIIELLDRYDMQETLLKFFQSSRLGSVTITVFLMKLFAPIRYILTFTITLIIARVLRVVRRKRAAKLMNKKNKNKK